MTNSDIIPGDPKLDPFFHESLDSLCITDYEGNFIKVNPAFQQLLGYSWEEIYSTKAMEFIHPSDRNYTSMQKSRLLDRTPLVNFENRYLKKSGEPVWLNWTSFVLPENQLIYSSARNVTLRKKIERDRKSNIRRLSMANQKLKRLNYATIHDLRSPLNNIMSLVNLIDLRMINDVETKEIIELIKESSTGLKLSLDSSLESFKIRDMDQKKLEQVDFLEILQKVQNSISNLISESQTEFLIDFTEVPNIRFKSNYLESIFLNLITNSIKYAQKDLRPIISIHTNLQEGVKTLTYSDNGSGFDMEKVADRIFKLNERFHKNKDSKGVGLYLVHNQVSDLGGTIEVESKVNEGTVFTITFK
ncbi:MAG TPA: PAS domain-containing sensor histidine kinase [Muricauda sp.]|nr:PAS domain-containing sensor histidine kinase [uncultured Allomuricauda sp.]MAO18020.1 PAS domain-containing sensor histidine kinase [Allomuricauda sp.]MBC72500.1 PAS domain-containing sensor histidine kinase [Allomuricauda sp.]HBU79619.1 PAS domain-containing sensor histidine kinase [Allomuricauda sp.]|tara:strand:+ start:10305 stop:11384 length:1080 start_codon:yes stop_codon:yes gene_type:complete